MINKVSPLILLIVFAYSLSGCNSNKKNPEQEDSSTKNTPVSTKEQEKKITRMPAISYVASPDTALLGKSFEAKVKLTDANLIQFQTSDGKSAGAELFVKLLFINRSKLTNKKDFTLSPSDARLEMDNGLAIPVADSSGKTNPNPGSTSAAKWKFMLPPTTKPAKLHLYLDGTRITFSLKTN